MTRRNGQGPDGSLTYTYMGMIFVWIRLYTLYILQTVTHYS